MQGPVTYAICLSNTLTSESIPYSIKLWRLRIDVDDYQTCSHNHRQNKGITTVNMAGPSPAFRAVTMQKGLHSKKALQDCIVALGTNLQLTYNLPVSLNCL